MSAILTTSYQYYIAYIVSNASKYDVIFMLLTGIGQFVAYVA